MPINEEKTILFVHIPKNGGSTLEQLFNLKIRYNKKQTNKEYKITLFQMIHQFPHYFENHMIPNDIRFHYQKLNKFNEYQSLQKLVSIRNPIDRIISLYHFTLSNIILNKNIHVNIPFHFLKMSFYQFLLTIQKIYLQFKPKFNEPYDFNPKNQENTMDLILYQMATPQIFYFIYFPENTENRYQYIKQLFIQNDKYFNSVEYNTIIYFEDFEDSLKRLTNTNDVPHVFKSNRSINFLEKLPNKEECLELIEDIYKEDFLFLGYPFQSIKNEHLNLNLEWFEVFLNLYSKLHKDFLL